MNVLSFLYKFSSPQLSLGSSWDLLCPSLTVIHQHEVIKPERCAQDVKLHIFSSQRCWEPPDWQRMWIIFPSPLAPRIRVKATLLSLRMGWPASSLFLPRPCGDNQGLRQGL